MDMPPFTARPQGKITRTIVLALLLLAPALLGIDAPPAPPSATSSYPVITIFVGSG